MFKKCFFVVAFMMVISGSSLYSMDGFIQNMRARATASKFIQGGLQGAKFGGGITGLAAFYMIAASTQPGMEKLAIPGACVAAGTLGSAILGGAISQLSKDGLSNAKAVGVGCGVLVGGAALVFWYLEGMGPLYRG